MSDSENVLGKRERDEHNVAGVADGDQSDEDIGPMPMPADANSTVKKKRKGEYIMRALTLDTTLSLNKSSRTKSYISSIFQMQTNITSPSCTGTR